LLERLLPARELLLRHLRECRSRRGEVAALDGVRVAPDGRDDAVAQAAADLRDAVLPCLLRQPGAVDHPADQDSLAHAVRPRAVGPAHAVRTVRTVALRPRVTLFLS